VRGGRFSGTDATVVRSIGGVEAVDVRSTVST